MGLNARQVDRAVGAVLGSAAGDALGAGYEFGPAVSGPIEMKGGGSFGWEPGEWTDDTQMASAILLAGEAARADGRVPTAEEVAAGFLAWYRSGPADVGFQTRSVLGRAEDAADLDRAAREYQERNPDKAGNGGLMRTGPVAVVLADRPVEEVAELAEEVAALTHRHADSVAACVLWSVAIHRLVNSDAPPPDGQGWVSLVAEGLSLVDDEVREEWSARIEESAEGPAARYTEQNGWVVHAFLQALTTIATTPVPDGAAAPDHLRQVLEAAVRPGKDADTVAAIAGALVGAAWGATAVPFAWRRKLNGFVASGDDVRPIDGRKLDHIARRAVVGVDAKTSWPGCEVMLDHYREFNNPRGIQQEVPIEGPGRLWFADIDGLEDLPLGENTTVVSLCRMGESDLPDDVERIEVGLIDDDTANAHLPWILADTADGIQQLLDEGRDVVAHCVASETRTPAIYATWLARHGGMPADEAVTKANEDLQASLRQAFARAVADALSVPNGTAS